MTIIRTYSPVFLLQIGGSGEILNPFRAIDPQIAIPLGMVLITIFPSMWFLQVFHIVDDSIDIGGSTQLSSRLEAVLVISIIGMMFGGFQQFPALRSLLILMAVAITLIIPLLVGLMTIRQIMVGSL